MDPTEAPRREMQADLNAQGRALAEVFPEKDDQRAVLTAQHGQVWDTSQLQADFDVRAFRAPFVIVRRKSDGKQGSLEFMHSPRFYFNFQEA